MGKRNLEAAIASVQERFVVNVRWLPFLLSPDEPLEGTPVEASLWRLSDPKLEADFLAWFNGHIIYVQIPLLAVATTTLAIRRPLTRSCSPAHDRCTPTSPPARRRT